MTFTGRRDVCSGLTPLVYNRDFFSGVQRSIFHRWHTLGIKIVGDLYQDTSVMSLGQLREKFQLEHNNFWGYLQIGHYLNSDTVKFPEDMLIFCELDLKAIQHFFSKAYYLFYSMDPGSVIFGTLGRTILVLNILMTYGWRQ